MTDVYWKEGCKIPDVMISESVSLIEKGLISANNDDNKFMIFEGTLHIHNVQKGTTMTDLKNFLKVFLNDFYSERGKVMGEFFLHFYKKAQAKNAITFILNTPNQFTNFEFIQHEKQEVVATEDGEELK